jgi:hypothetical protein
MKGDLPVAHRIMIFISLLAFVVVQPAFGAVENAPPRQKNKKNTPAAAEKAPAVNILSIIPAQGEPGITVTLYGTGFSPKTTVFLGNSEIPAKVIGPKQLSFDIPKLNPGLYALYLKREDGATSKPYNFSLLPLKPVALSITPDIVIACAAGHDREATIAGRNFQEGSQVLFDGAAIRSRFSSSETLSFNVPQIAGGLHQVQVRNPGDTVSGVLGLIIDARPEITSVDRGEEYVNYYNLVIEGKNFQQNSTLVVMEERSLEETPSKLAVDVKRVTTSAAPATEREQLLYINCNRLVYQRYPYSTIPKNFRVQVVNPAGGGESSLVSVSAP